jgi:sporulation protein YlmC with PRC-barrel domain
MPHYGILRDHKMEDIDDLRGADVYGVNDEKLGTIDDVIFDHSSGDIRYIVLKTGGMLSSKKVMVPANRVEPYGNHDDKFYAELDKERLEMLPEFKEDTMKAQGDWSTYEKDYEKRWTDGEVLYNKNTGRIITPPMEQVQPAGSQPLNQQARESLDRNLTPQRMGKRDELWGVGDSGTGKTTLQPQKASIAGREDAIRQNAGQQDIGQRSLGRECVPQDASRENPNPLPNQTTREVEGTMGTDFQVSSSPESSASEAMREPGVYKLDPVIETEQGAGPTDRQEINRGRRWNDFQQGLRSRRQKIVIDCPTCASQDKAA